MSEPKGRPIGRRAFLGVLGLGLAGLAVGDRVVHLAGKAAAVVPEPLRRAIPVGEGWRIYAVDPPYPRFDRTRWRLRIDGLVQRPVELTYDDLLALPQARQVSDLHCVTGWSVSDVHWAGVRFAALFAAAGGLTPGAGALAFRSMERPYVDTLTVDQLGAAPDAMVAVEMDGAPLTRAHGAPARVVMPQ